MPNLTKSVAMTDGGGGIKRKKSGNNQPNRTITNRKHSLRLFNNRKQRESSAARDTCRDPNRGRQKSICFLSKAVGQNR